MNPSAYVLPLVLMLVFGGYAVWMMVKRSQAMGSAGPAMQSFFQRTGFRYGDMPPEPVEHHVQRALHEMQNWSTNRVTHYVRNFHGITVHHQQATYASEGSYSVSCSWSADLPAPPRTPFHVAERSLSSLGKAVVEAFSNSTRVWSPRHPHEVQTGIPAIDQRFRVFGRDPAAVQQLFQRDAALVASILAQVEVDLWVDDRQAVFADPMQKNMIAAMGGTVGQMTIGFDLGKRFELAIPVHERISELLALSVRAATT